MKGGTLFSGIGAPECAMPDLDWRWCAEIDPFASAVHRARFPGVPNLGNVLEVDWHAVEPVDLVVGGPPCQGFSVAGQRGGLADPRGNLSLAYVRVLDAIDPEFSLTENVPGWLSMGDNSFGHFLALMVGADAPLVPARGQRWTDSGVVDGPRRTCAWRILDAQFHGVPQRRRRVFVVAVRGAGNWRCAEALFPVTESLRGDSPPRREAGQGIARPIAPCIGASGRGFERTGDPRGQDCLIAFGGNRQSGEIDVATAVNAHGGPHGRLDFETETFIAHTLPADGFDASEDGTGRGTPIIAVQCNGSNVGIDLPSLRAGNQHITGGGPAVAYGIRSDAARQGEAKTPSPDAEGRVRLRDPGFNVYEETAPTLDAAPHAVAFDTMQRASNEGNLLDLRQSAEGARVLQQAPDTLEEIRRSDGLQDTAPETVRHMPETGTREQPLWNALHASEARNLTVRRLTPREAERLQGFPDNWTLITWRGKPAADGPRYRALGNSMAVPVVRWILDRIEEVTMTLTSAEREELT